MHDRGHLLTEQPNRRSADLDALPLDAAFDVMNAEDRGIADAVAAAKPQIVAAIERIVAALRAGGRLIYVGAGTSGRLGVLDAAECPPTFLSDPDMIVGVIAGGDEALKRSVEQAEDDPNAGAARIAALNVGTNDVVLGIATGGTTPFVHGALAEGRRRQAGTIFLACVPQEQADDQADVSIRVLTGPEVLTGSTRLKAGIATKMVLNRISTLAMVRLGKVFGNLMVDVNARGCAKLTDRAIRTVAAACGVDRDAASQVLDRADWHVKTAIVMHRLGIDAAEARRRLTAADGFVRRVLATAPRAKQEQAGVRVALLVTDLERGGTPLRLARLARGLRAAGVDVSVGCLAPPGPISADLAAEGFSTFACNARNACDWRALVRLHQHLHRRRPHVLHATLTHANVAARLVGLTLRIPVLTSTATIEVERRWHVWAERLTAPLDRGHVVNSRALAEHVSRAFWLPRRRVHIVPPSLAATPRRIARDAARAALGILPHEFVVVWAGRFDPVKRLEHVIACAEILSDAPARFLLAGDGPDRLTLERLIRLSSAAGRIHLLGWQNDVAPLLSAADAFLFPSLTEGMPNAVLEALACGVPVVGSDIPALRELSDDGRRLVLADGDAASHYAAALRALRGDPDRRARIGAAAAEWATHALDPQATVAALVRVYRSVAGAARSRPLSPSPRTQGE